MGRRARKEGASLESVLTGDAKMDAAITTAYQTPSGTKLYPTRDRKGREVHVTVPED